MDNVRLSDPIMSLIHAMVDQCNLNNNSTNVNIELTGIAFKSIKKSVDRFFNKQEPCVMYGGIGSADNLKGEFLIVIIDGVSIHFSTLIN